MIKVVVADSHPIVHKGVKASFKNSTEISITGKALVPDDLFDILERNMVDIIILELDLQKSDGLAVLRRIKNEQPGVRVLIFSNQPEEVYAISSLKAGASGYLNKKANPTAIRHAILKIASGGVYITNELAQTIAFDESTGRPRRMFKSFLCVKLRSLRCCAMAKGTRRLRWN